MTTKIFTFAMVEMGSFLVSLSVGMLLHGYFFSVELQPLNAFLSQIILPPLCLLVSFYCNDLYNFHVVNNFTTFARRFAWSLVASFFLLLSLSLFIAIPRLAQSGLFASVLCTLIGVGAVLPLRWFLYAFGHVGFFTERVLIVGTGELAQKIATAMRSLFPLGYTIAGFVDDHKSSLGEAIHRLPSPILGSLDRLEQIIGQFRPNRIIVALSERRGRMPLPTLLRAHWAGVIVEDGIKVHERFSGKLAIESLTPGFLIFSTDFRKSPFEMFLRRAVSLILALVGLIFLAPLFPLIAIAIKLDSKGPVFFVQKRAGLNGRVFPLFKFRTMRIAARDDETDSVWNRDIDSRITRIGRWLRKTHFDELPQFFNILWGDMDIVGPRPEIASNIQTMQERIPYYSLRMSVRPGVTGWAQVKHGYAVSQEDVTEKIRYDLYYIKHRSLWLDLQILLDTAKSIMFGQEKSVAQASSVRDSHGILTLDVDAPTSLVRRNVESASGLNRTAEI